MKLQTPPFSSSLHPFPSPYVVINTELRLTIDFWDDTAIVMDLPQMSLVILLRNLRLRGATVVADNLFRSAPTCRSPYDWKNWCYKVLIKTCEFCNETKQGCHTRSWWLRPAAWSLASPKCLKGFFEQERSVNTGSVPWKARVIRPGD